MALEKFIHPELREGEIFLINVRDGERWIENLPEWLEQPRLGNIAYVTDGSRIVPNMKPLFAKLKNEDRKSN